MLPRGMIRRASSQDTPGADDWYWVEDAAAARFLLSPVTRPYYLVFLQGPLDLHDAATRLQLKRTTLRYHVRRLVDWGLLAPLPVTSSRERQRFEAAHPRLYLPFGSSGHVTLDELLLQMHAPLLERFMRRLVLAGQRDTSHAPHLGGVTLSLESVDFSVSPPPNVATQDAIDASTWNSWTTLALTPEQAQALKAELAAVWQRFRQQAQRQPGTRDYTLLLGLAPEQD